MATTRAKHTTEPAVLRRFLQEAAYRGWSPVSVDFGDGPEPTPTADAVAKLAGDVDMCGVLLRNADGRAAVLSLVWQGCIRDRVPADEAVQCLSDYSVTLEPAVRAVHEALGVEW